MKILIELAELFESIFSLLIETFVLKYIIYVVNVEVYFTGFFFISERNARKQATAKTGALRYRQGRRFIFFSMKSFSPSTTSMIRWNLLPQDAAVSHGLDCNHVGRLSNDIAARIIGTTPFSVLFCVLNVAYLYRRCFENGRLTFCENLVVVSYW